MGVSALMLFCVFVLRYTQPGCVCFMLPQRATMKMTDFIKGIPLMKAAYGKNGTICPDGGRDCWRFLSGPDSDTQPASTSADVIWASNAKPLCDPENLAGSADALMDITPCLMAQGVTTKQALASFARRKAGRATGFCCNRSRFASFVAKAYQTGRHAYPFWGARKIKEGESFCVVRPLFLYRAQMLFANKPATDWTQGE